MTPMNPTKVDLENSREIAEKWVVRNGFRPFDMSQKAESDSLTEVIAQALAETRAEAWKRTNEVFDVAWQESKVCNDPAHDVRYCSTCNAMKDGMEYFMEKLKHSLTGEEGK